MTVDQANEFYHEVYDNAQQDVMNQALSYKRGNKLIYSRIKPLQLKLAWESYMRMGIVLRPNIIDSIQEIILYNTCILHVCTACMGHDTYDGIREMVESYELSKKQEKKLKHVFLDWQAEEFAVFSNGHWLISDYAFNTINPLLNKLLQTEIYEEKLLLIDRILNVVHQRSDLAEIYVEGGSKTLSILSASPSELINSN